MNESNTFFFKTFSMFIGFCFMFSACLRFFMPEKNIANSLLFLGIGICLMMLSMLKYSSKTSNKSEERQ